MSRSRAVTPADRYHCVRATPGSGKAHRPELEALNHVVHIHEEYRAGWVPTLQCSCQESSHGLEPSAPSQRVPAHSRRISPHPRTPRNVLPAKTSCMVLLLADREMKAPSRPLTRAQHGATAAGGGATLALPTTTHLGNQNNLCPETGTGRPTLRVCTTNRDAPPTPSLSGAWLLPVALLAVTCYAATLVATPCTALRNAMHCGLQRRSLRLATSVAVRTCT